MDKIIVATADGLPEDRSLLFLRFDGRTGMPVRSIGPYSPTEMHDALASTFMRHQIERWLLFARLYHL